MPWWGWAVGLSSTGSWGPLQLHVWCNNAGSGPLREESEPPSLNPAAQLLQIGEVGWPADMVATETMTGNEGQEAEAELVTSIEA